MSSIYYGSSLRTHLGFFILSSELLLKIEDRGYKFQKFDLSKIRSSLLSDEAEPNEMDGDNLFFFDSKGNSFAEEKVSDHEIEMMDSIFFSAARSIKSKPGGGTKRKGSKVNGEVRDARVVKHKASETSGESDVEDPSSSEMEDSD